MDFIASQHLTITKLVIELTDLLGAKTCSESVTGGKRFKVMLLFSSRKIGSSYLVIIIGLVMSQLLSMRSRILFEHDVFTHAQGGGIPRGRTIEQPIEVSGFRGNISSTQLH